MKRTIVIIIILAYLMTGIASAATIKIAGGNTIYVRSGPGTKYGKVTTVSNGDEVTVLEEGSIWSKITAYTGNGYQSGYVKNLYIKGLGKNYADGTKYLSKSQTGTVQSSSGKTINMRSGASTGNKVIKSVKPGTKVTILGTNGDFYLVSITGTQGYIHKSLVKTGSASSSSSKKTYSVTSNGLNLRTEQSKSSRKICVIPKGGKVTVVARNNSGWWKVKYHNETGYVWKGYLK